MSPRVSVVVPCYDHARFLPEAVESVVAQTYRDLELVVVDDGSPDDTAAVTERLIAAHPDVDMRLVRRENGGLPAARNTGIAAARGELVCCLDADDEMTPTYLEEAVRALDAHPEVGIVYGDRFNFGDVDTFERHLPYDFELLKHANFLNVAAVYRRSAYDAAGGYKPMTSYEDWEFWISCGELGFVGLHVPAMVWRYRVREGSMYSHAKARDQKLKAEIVRYHPGLYGPHQTRWANGVHAGDTEALAAGTELGRIPAEAELAASAPRRRSRDLRVLAILPSYNEADVIEHAIRALADDGIDVYVVDNCSSDGTDEVARTLLGQGVVHVERFPDDTGFDARARDSYMWSAILARIEEVAAASTEYDWIVFSNPDEFRESPWPGVSFREGLALVDELGFNAVDFELFNFRPTDDDFVPGTDVREHLRYWEPGEEFDGMQIKAWRNAGPARLVPTGGHSVAFDGRRVFPIRFLLRHYPIRGETHGRRKVFDERLSRFTPEERAYGWHIQYDEFANGEAEFLRDPAELRRWDADAERAAILARGSLEVLLALAARDGDLLSRPPDATHTSAWFARATGVRLDQAALQTIANTASTLIGSTQPVAAVAQGASPEDAPLLAALVRLLGAEHRLAGNPLEAARASRLAGALASVRPSLATRSFATLAFADELVDAPELLEAYGRAVSADDDATLVIAAVGTGAEALIGRLGETLARAGLADAGPDMLAVPVTAAGDVAERFALSVQAVYSRRPTPGPLARLPRFDDDSLDELRAAARSDRLAA